jgi:hypothetical protein
MIEPARQIKGVNIEDAYHHNHWSGCVVFPVRKLRTGNTQRQELQHSLIHETVGEGFKGLVPFKGSRTGIALAMIVDTGGASIIKVDTKASAIDSFADDKGQNNLVKTKGISKDGFGRFPKVSQDQKAWKTGAGPHVMRTVLPANFGPPFEGTPPKSSVETIAKTSGTHRWGAGSHTWEAYYAAQSVQTTTLKVV